MRQKACYNNIINMITKKNQKLILAEIVLIIASVFIFRGLWLLLDRIEIMNRNGAFWISLVVGIMVSIPALRHIIKNS